jgi:hypothetical protein
MDNNNNIQNNHGFFSRVIQDLYPNLTLDFSAQDDDEDLYDMPALEPIDNNEVPSLMLVDVPSLRLTIPSLCFPPQAPIAAWTTTIAT